MPFAVRLLRAAAEAREPSETGRVSCPPSSWLAATCRDHRLARHCNFNFARRTRRAAAPTRQRSAPLPAMTARVPPPAPSTVASPGATTRGSQSLRRPPAASSACKTLPRTAWRQTCQTRGRRATAGTWSVASRREPTACPAATCTRSTSRRSSRPGCAAGGPGLVHIWCSELACQRSCMCYPPIYLAVLI